MKVAGRFHILLLPKAYGDSDAIPCALDFAGEILGAQSEPSRFVSVPAMRYMLEDPAEMTSDLSQRGLVGVKMFVSDEAGAIGRPLERFYPEVPRQSCTFHRLSALRGRHIEVFGEQSRYRPKKSRESTASLLISLEMDEYRVNLEIYNGAQKGNSC